MELGWTWQHMAPHTTTPRRLAVVVRTPWIRALARRKRTLARTEGCRGMQGMLFCSVPHMSHGEQEANDFCIVSADGRT